MIRLRNVRVHNLKGVDLDIEDGELLLFCGLSGSGKSSLALDTLYAEGQRRYLECLSPQTRQFLTQLDRPDADLIDGIPPAIAVKAYRGGLDRRTTVASATELAEYLGMLFRETAEAFCPQCELPIRRDDAQSVASKLSGLPEGVRYQIVFPAPRESSRQAALTTARSDGFSKAIAGNRLVDLAGDLDLDEERTGASRAPVQVVVDRLKSGRAEVERITESLEIAFQFGRGRSAVLFDPASGQDLVDTWGTGTPLDVEGERWWPVNFSREGQCRRCGYEARPLTPSQLRASGAQGVCPDCEGLGRPAAPVETCSTCRGTGFKNEVLAYRLPGHDPFGPAGPSFADLLQMSVTELRTQLDAWPLSSRQRQALGWVLNQVRRRLEFLDQVGLSYLTLSRPVSTLSAGEAQRVSLTSCLSSDLVNALYVLDEPTVGLHARDVGRLWGAVKQLQQRGNTVVLVDHDEHLISAVPRVVELGPGAGADGGQIVFDGTPGELKSDGKTVTADFLAGRRGFMFGKDQRRTPRGQLRIAGARGHNLKSIDVSFPLGCLTVVAGVSGAGKSTLVQQTLVPAVADSKQQSSTTALPHDQLSGENQFDEIVSVDRSPIGRTARSNPVTYVKAFDEVRRCFAETADARAANLNLSKFSFNASGGRCSQCDGTGQLTVEMQFLPSVHRVCDACNGTRYRPEILAVKYRGRNIAEVLAMTVREAFLFFRGQPKLQAKLKALIDVGLDYLTLGQPAPTLSAGEAQRLKLAQYLNVAGSRRVLFVMDEPTTGLHMADVTRLLDCFDTLLDVGHSLIVVEHHLRLIRRADWIVELGPGPADLGGAVVAVGTPEQLASHPDSPTGRWLGD